MDQQAILVSVPRDLSRVKAKVLFQLTLRQLICFGLAAGVGLLAYFFFCSWGSTSLATFGMVIVMVPGFLVAMYEKNGEPFEKVVEHFVQMAFVRPGERPYQIKQKNGTRKGGANGVRKTEGPNTKKRRT